MTPYYVDDHVTLYHGDARDITAWLDADVLITDPPYGTHMLGTGRSRHKGGYGRRDRYDPGDGMGARIANDDTTECRDTVLSKWGGIARC